MRHIGTCGNFWGRLLMWAMRNDRAPGIRNEPMAPDAPAAVPPALRQAA